MHEILTAQYEGILKLGDSEIKCYVLTDGTRVLSGRGMQEALKMVDTEEGKQTSGTRLTRYFEQKTLKPFIFKDKSPGHFEPLRCKFQGKTIHGYEATILADICEAFLEARKHVQLSSRQAIIAEQCEVLIRAFARVGIIALVDEATGYQYKREKDELQRILKTYISEELLPWQKRFPDIFYRELFRLNRWDFTVKGIKQRPSVIGIWTNKLIYEQLPNGVLQALKSKTPKTPKGNNKARYHQSLTLDVGNPHLEAQIQQIITIFRISDTMDEMWSHFEKLNDRKEGQLQLQFSPSEKPKA